jgi:heptosyltransferase-2
MALPAVRALKESDPNCNIFLVAKQYLCDIYSHIKEIDEVIAIPDRVNWKNFTATAGTLKKYNFRTGILFTNSFSSALLFRLAGIKNLFGYSKDLRGFLLSRKIPFPRDDKHHVHFYLDLVDAYRGKSSTLNRDTSCKLVIAENEKETVSDKLAKIGVQTKRSLLGISPSAAYGSAKEWLPERFRKLILRITREMPGTQILLFGTAGEKGKISRIVESLEHKATLPHLHNLAGQLSLREAIVAISLCRAFISNDSGLMHIASSFELPLIALFGPTRPEKTAPLNSSATVIHYPPQCSPCLDRVCPYPDHPCMNAITVEEVFAKLKSKLAGHKS